MSALTGYILVMLAAFGLGANSIFVKLLYEYNITPAQVLLLQHVIATLFFWLLAIFKKDIVKVKIQSLGQLFILGVFGSFTAGILFYYTLEILGAGLTTMLFYTFPAYVTIFAAIFFKEKIGLLQRLCLLLTLLGAALALDIFQFDVKTLSVTGVFLGCGAAVSAAFQHLYAQHILQGIKPLTVSLYSTTFSTLPVFFIQDVTDLAQIPQNWNVCILVLCVAVAASFLPPILVYGGIKIVGAAKASVVAAFELPVTIILAYLCLGEVLSIVQVLGSLLILSSVILLELEDLYNFRHEADFRQKRVKGSTKKQAF